MAPFFSVLPEHFLFAATNSRAKGPWPLVYYLIITRYDARIVAQTLEQQPSDVN